MATKKQQVDPLKRAAMPCGNRPLVKMWDKPRKIRVVTASRYEQNEPSVKRHWKNVLKEMELSYRDEKFWESQAEQVRELVGPVIFKRLVKIFNLPDQESVYEPKPDIWSLIPSENFYNKSEAEHAPHETRAATFSISEYELSEHAEEEEEEQEEESVWSTSTVLLSDRKTSRSRSMMRSSYVMEKSFARTPSKTFSKFFSHTVMKSMNRLHRGSSYFEHDSAEESATSLDDVEVHTGGVKKMKRHSRNPHYDMLYCNESETDMIKWNSKYKQKVFEISASDEFSKKAELKTKQISKDFFDWWHGLGNVEFKSEIKRPEDIEALFQVWFDEHASRGLMLDPKIIPCVLQSIADYAGVPHMSCDNALKRQIAFDIHAETSPAHTMAFGTALPHEMKHVPPRNNTKETWHCVKIPEDLKTMSCVWDDIEHLTSTKAFQKWLTHRPHLPMPPCLRKLGTPDKKQLFVVPSDFVIRDGGSVGSQDLALPVSQFSLELKEVLSKLMNQ